MSHLLRRMAQNFFSALFTSTLLWILLILVSTVLVLLFDGCSPSTTISSDSTDIQTDSLDQEEFLSSEMEDEEETETFSPITRPPKELLSREDNPAIDRRKVLTDIMALMGIRYKRNGNDSTGFDCSGFTLKIFTDALEIELPRSSRAQYTTGKPVEQDSLKFGDLVFFKTRRIIPSHVGIYVGDGLFAHASLKNGVTISLLDSKYYRKRYLGARRIIE
ncbi:MAG: C40 family peptidase [Bacteroidota bacterium]|nr:C40 family peptidase [Bacteroidota bacterium]